MVLHDDAIAVEHDDHREISLMRISINRRENGLFSDEDNGACLYTKI